MQGSPGRVRPSIQQAGSQIVSPRATVASSGSAPVYRKQKEWQELVNRIAADNVKARDDLLQELWQMREQLADAHCEHSELQNSIASMCAAQEQTIDGKDHELQALQARLRGATVQEIQAKRAAALEEATCKAQSRESEMAALSSENALIAKTASAVARERDLEAKIMRMQTHEVAVERSVEEARMKTTALCRELEGNIQKAQVKELELQQSLALVEASQVAKFNHLEASLELSKRNLQRAGTTAAARHGELEADLAAAARQQVAAQEAEISREDHIAKLHCEQASSAEQLQVQKIEMQRAVAVTETLCSSKCQKLEAEVQEARSASELAFSAQLRTAQVRAEDFETELSQERNRFEERLQVLNAQVGRQKLKKEEKQQASDIDAKRIASAADAGLTAKLSKFEAALSASKQTAEYAEEAVVHRQHILRTELSTAREGEQKLQKALKEAAASHNVKIQEVEGAIERCQVREIELRHEVARAHVEEECERRAHHVALGQAKLALTRAEAAGQAAHRNCEVRLEAVQRQEVEEKQTLVESEAAASKKTDSLISSLQLLHVQEIEAQHAAAETHALSTAKCQELEVHMEQLQSDEINAKEAAESKVVAMQEELATAEETTASAKRTLEQQEEHLRAANPFRRVNRAAAPGVVVGERRHFDRMAAARNRSAEPDQKLPGGSVDGYPPSKPSGPRDSSARRRVYAPGAEAGAGIGN